jgi:hypothetical protein
LLYGLKSKANGAIRCSNRSSNDDVDNDDNDDNTLPVSHGNIDLVDVNDFDVNDDDNSGIFTTIPSLHQQISR